MVHIELANIEDSKAEYEALQKIPAYENGFRNKYFGITEAKFKEKTLPSLIAASDERKLSKENVPSSFYFLWDNDKIVGLFKLRHYLCDNLKEHGGHISYAIIEEYRDQGYASRGLRLLLNEARDNIVEGEFWLDVRKDNIASQKVTLNNGVYKVTSANWRCWIC